MEACGRFFREAYRRLAEDAQKLRQTCQRYLNGDFRNAAEQCFTSNEKRFEYWHEAAGIDASASIDLEGLISGMERAAAKMDSALQRKSANITVTLGMERVGDLSMPGPERGRPSNLRTQCLWWRYEFRRDRLL